MRTIAVGIKDIKKLIEIHKIDETGYVKLEPFVDDVRKKGFRFYGSIRINNLDIVVANGEKNINSSNRYCKTQADLAELFVIVPRTLANWRGYHLIDIEKKRIPLRKYEGEIMYDAKDLLSQLKRLLKKQNADSKL